MASTEFNVLAKKGSSPAQLWDFRIRLGFWGFGLVCAVILSYTTRHFINGDAIAYMDMAEAFRTGLWKESVLLGYSPGYSLLLAMIETVFPTTPDRELFLAKFLNFIIFIGAMAACDLFVSRLVDESDSDPSRKPLPSHLLRAMCFSAFLVSSLIWVRIQIVAPDMLVVIFVLLSVVTVLNIKRDHLRYSNFLVLGLTSGLGYICKTFFFPFSMFLIILAGIYCNSLKKAVPRLLSAVVVMLIVSAPIIISQSLETGRLSIGEVGSYNYSFYVAGQGARIHNPKVIYHNPDILYYEHGRLSTYPHGDPAYWALGITPVFNLQAQLKAIRSSLIQLLSAILWPITVVLLWFVTQFRTASFVPLRIIPPSTFIMMALVCLAGTATYCIVSMEMRYVAAFLFLGFAALAVAPRYNESDLQNRWSIALQATTVAAIFVGMVIIFVADQSVRSLYNSGNKVSHRETFLDMLAMKDTLEANGIGKGDKVAVFSPINFKLYWAKMAGVRIMAEITGVDSFFGGTSVERSKMLDVLKINGFKAVVAKLPQFFALSQEGWTKVPGAHGYYVNFLDRHR
ncbi:MAG: hypothetical protein M1511_14420 [Deltaproteobacteria bacterium]|nr:hypothetical protein [Deltaproteobacteria bacterium]